MMKSLQPLSTPGASPNPTCFVKSKQNWGVYVPLQPGNGNGNGILGPHDTVLTTSSFTHVCK